MAWLLNWLWLAARRGLDARDTLTLALSREGRGDLLSAILGWFWERGRLARKAALEARRTLALALSHEGRGDLIVVLGARASRPQ